MSYPSINDNEVNLLKKIAENTADIAAGGGGGGGSLAAQISALSDNPNPLPADITVTVKSADGLAYSSTLSEFFASMKIGFRDDGVGNAVATRFLGGSQDNYRTIAGGDPDANLLETDGLVLYTRGDAMPIVFYDPGATHRLGGKIMVANRSGDSVDLTAANPGSFFDGSNGTADSLTLNDNEIILLENIDYKWSVVARYPAAVPIATASTLGVVSVGAGLAISGGGVISNKNAVLFDHYANAGNVTTGETSIYNDTIPSGKLAANGDKLELKYGGVFVASATATRRIKLWFAGVTYFDTGAIILSLSSAWTVFATIIRVDATTVRYMVSLTTEGAALASYTGVGELTSVDLSDTNSSKLTLQAAGTGAATNDIVAKLGSISYVAKA